MRYGVWEKCLRRLKEELSAQQFNTWIRPIQVVEGEQQIELLAPNRFLAEWIQDKYVPLIAAILEKENGAPLKVVINIGSSSDNSQTRGSLGFYEAKEERAYIKKGSERRPVRALNGLKAEFTFENFVEGKSNQLARAASLQVSGNPGAGYNPLYICGGVGLGKTHLMQAVGNRICATKPNARVVYLHSEKFVADMVKALQHNAINQFKAYYRNVDALLIDDIQFFAGKERSQEEFFHTFNALLESQQQIVLTCDRYPKEVSGVEERLKSRFGWGLTVAIEPAELETRVAILMSKAQQSGIEIPQEVAFFIAKKFRSNIRELEGALHRVIANAHFTGKGISTEFAKDALRDLLALQEKLVTLENIQRTVAEYCKVRLSDLLSKRRNRSIARPRQIAMTLAKELTSHSYPEIGEAFGGRDHTTVMHACKTIAALRKSDPRTNEDYVNLERILTS